MRRSSRSAKKGQWFLISAVLITGAFLAMSVVLRGYATLDTAAQAGRNEQYYFFTIMNQVDRAQIVGSSQCAQLGTALSELRALAIKEMNAQGYDLEFSLRASGPCSYDRTIRLRSDQVELFKTTRPGFGSG